MIFAQTTIENATTLLDFVMVGAVLMTLAQFLGSHAVDLVVRLPAFQNHEPKAAARLASNIIGALLTLIAIINALIDDLDIIKHGRFLFLVGATYGILRTLTESSYVSRSGTRLITGKEDEVQRVDYESIRRQAIPPDPEELVPSLQAGDAGLRQAMIAGHPIPGQPIASEMPPEPEPRRPLFE